MSLSGGAAGSAGLRRGKTADPGAPERGHPLGVLRAAVCGHEPGLLPPGGAGGGADQRRRRRQGHERRGVRPGGHGPGRAGGRHLCDEPGQGGPSRDLCPADQAGRLLPGGPGAGALLLGGRPGPDHHRGPGRRRAGDDPGICAAAAGHRAPAGRGGGHLGAVQHDGRGLHRRQRGLCDPV
mgnify:FL=1